MENILSILISAIIVSTVISILCEVLLRVKSEQYNFRRKNSHLTYFAGGSPESDFIERYVTIRNKMAILSVILFVISGILGIVLALLD